MLPLADSESTKEVRVIKDIDLSHHRDPIHITRPFANAKRSVNAGSANMMQSEIVPWITTHACTP